MKTLHTLTAAVFALALFALPSLAADPTPATSPATTQYTCPMHPEVLKDEPAKCPACGMKLLEKKAGATPSPSK